jgi:gentisate 1,2-dioxygenase
MERMPAPLALTFKVFIACEDQAALLQAKKVQGIVETLCGQSIALSRVFWNFALLRHEELRKFAAMEAADSEMIVVSLGGGNDLPAHIKEWVESLPVRAHAGQAALVTLIGSGQDSARQHAPQIEYLRHIAEARGMDFFCNQDDWENLEMERPDFVLAPRWKISDRIPCLSRELHDLVDKLNIQLKRRYEY